MAKIAKRIIIKEDTGGQCGVSYYTNLTLTKNSISYKEETDFHIDSMFYAERDYSYKYKIISALFESKFEELSYLIEETKEKSDAGEITSLVITDCGVNKIFIVYDDNSKLIFEFYGNLYENGFDEIANTIRSMIPACEQVSAYLMTIKELEEFNNPSDKDYIDLEERAKKAIERTKTLNGKHKL